MGLIINFNMKYLLKTAFRVLVFPFAFVYAVFQVAKRLKMSDLTGAMQPLLGKMGTRDNVKIELFDKNGQRKRLFKHNFLGRFLFNLGIDTKFFLFGKYKDYLQSHNLVVNGAFADVAGLINGSASPASYDFIGIGTGTTAPAATDTALETEINNDGNPTFTNRGGAGVASRITTTVTNDTAQVVKTFTIGAFTPAVTECGLFNANSGGSMFARQTFSAINLSNGDNFQTTWQISVASA